MYLWTLRLQAHANESSRQTALESKVMSLQQQLECRQDTVNQLKGDLAALEAHHKHVSPHMQCPAKAV